MKLGTPGVLLLLLCIAPINLLFAHDASLNSLTVTLEWNKTTVVLSTHIYKMKPALGLPDRDPTPEEYGRIVKNHLHLLLDGRQFTPSSPVPAIAVDSENGVVFLTLEEHRMVQTVEVTALPFPEIPNSQCAITVIQNGQVVGQDLLNAGTPTYLLKTVLWNEVAGKYFLLGLEHIAGGLDHILFVVGLILWGGGLRKLIKVVTAFTLAHSITLTIATTGIFTLPPLVVEPLIALSITAVAFENLRQRQLSPEHGMVKARDFRPYLAFGFGLIHGFGFAGALTEVGLPQAFLVVALGCFNLGVEAGQVVVVLLLAPVLAFIQKKIPSVAMGFLSLSSAGIGLAGAYWFVQRLLQM